jgi:hypothetical protein
MLFSTIELLFDGNNELLDSLKTQADTGEPLVGYVFTQLMDKLCQYYGVFCNHQKEAMNQIDQALKTSPSFKSFEDACKQHPETGTTFECNSDVFRGIGTSGLFGETISKIAEISTVIIRTSNTPSQIIRSQGIAKKHSSGTS